MVLLTMPGNVSCVGSVYHCLYIQSSSLNPERHIQNWGKVLYRTAMVIIGVSVCNWNRRHKMVANSYCLNILFLHALLVVF